jgi:selenocysteine lyase/cysteine desulfurase
MSCAKLLCCLLLLSISVSTRSTLRSSLSLSPNALYPQLSSPGSFGSLPLPIIALADSFRKKAEARPDVFIRYTYPHLLDESRAAAASFLSVPTSTMVFVPNATTGVNTILRSIPWNPDGKDVILHFSSVYGGCGRAIDYVVETSYNLVNSHEIPLTFPISDASVLTAFETSISTLKSAGLTPRLALFDTVTSQPGVRVPFEALTTACRAHSILSLIDGAHSVGHIPLNLSTLAPDFYVSNAHKWLYVPRGCAILYVPESHQPLVRSTLPTSHGFIPSPKPGVQVRLNPLPPAAAGKSTFVTNFEFVGTVDSTPYLCLPEAIKWRREACGGEEAIMEYNVSLARKGAKVVAGILGTKVLDNEEGTLSDCCMSQVLLPISIGDRGEGEEGPVVKAEEKGHVLQWMTETIVKEYKTFIAIIILQGQYWVRFSGQIYLDIDDFEFAGKALKDICEKVGKGEYVGAEVGNLH